MNHSNVINRILSYKWEPWLERPFNAFVQSLFEDATREESFKKIGFSDITLRGQLYQDHVWYINQELLSEMDKQIEVYLYDHSIFDVTEVLQRFYLQIEKNIPKAGFNDVYEALSSCCTFIWLAHGLESYYQKRLQEEVPKYIKNNVDKFIGDASFPLKKNEHAYMEEMMRTDASDEEIQKKFCWLKCRDGFSDGFTIEEIKRMRKELPAHHAYVRVEIPAELKQLFSEVQELVFFRTARTDVFYKIFYLSRPIITEFAEKLGLSFQQISFYRAKTLLEERLEKYSPHFTFAYFDGEVLFQDDPIIKKDRVESVTEFKGNIAFKGKISGTVKIVKNVSELGKVELGDILVTQMTFPSFIPAMIRASAFVTDEGGITCHAAIVAREMKKPCIIGTKIATKVLKDGDVVEVDANKGVVKILNR